MIPGFKALWLGASLLLGVAAQEQPVLQQDLVYGKAGDVELKLDLALPAAGAGPFPALLFIHGGGWSEGNKSRYRPEILNAARGGYVAATVGYRLAPAHVFPAQIEDVKCAVRYLRSRAKDLRLDPNRIAAVGESAGGHLALLLGLTGEKDGFDGGSGHPKFSSRIQAVVNFYGPTDFTAHSTFDPRVVDLVLRLLGTGDRGSPLLAKASPITYVDAKDPPFLTLQGSRDPVVPKDQADRLHAALKKAGVRERLEIIESETHQFVGKDQTFADQVTAEFLAKILKK